MTAAPQGHPGASIPPPAAPRGSRYGWFLGVVIVLVIGYITLNTTVTRPQGSRGIAPGQPLPPFAVPLATGGLNGDANIATRPNQGVAGRRPACEVRGPEILNSCQLAQRGPVALGLFVPGGGCARILDELSALRRQFPGVQLAGVAIKGARSDVRRLVKRRRWGFPVGYDRDGALANLYRMAVCSQITFAARGGRVEGQALLGTPTASQIRARLEAVSAPPGGSSATAAGR